VSAGPTVLFVVHEGRRSGPPIYAHHLLTWLAEHTALDVETLLLAPGPLVEDFAALGPTTVVEADDDPAALRSVLESADLVYLNTAITVAAVRRSGARPRRVLSHVHELDIGLRHYLDEADHDHLLEVTDRFLVGPDVARDNLITGHGVPADRIGQVPYFVPPHEPVAARSPATRAELGIPADAVVVGACGTRDWRKAPDLFVHLARELDQRALDVPLHFVWLGSAIPSEPHWDEAFDLRHIPLRSGLDFVEHQAVPQRWMAEYDVFALTSREDCFPLVCLASAELGTPVVCFDTGGIPEMLETCDGGRVVPYPDVVAMADEVQALAADRAGREAMGARARYHVLAHHQLAHTGPAVAAELAELLG
jgi:glycosyltransferase involved in cell wall biosynthesis